jgi:hypothetical protein
LKDAKVAHDWGSNIATIQSNGIVRTITIIKHFTKRNVVHLKPMVVTTHTTSL